MVFKKSGVEKQRFQTEIVMIRMQRLYIYEEGSDVEHMGPKRLSM